MTHIIIRTGVISIANRRITAKRFSGSVKLTKALLDDIMKNAGRLPPETGGMLASSKDRRIIDRCCFDEHSKNTPGSFYYDVESMSAVFRGWKERGFITNVIYHSHPFGMCCPSYHDISSALIHIRFFGMTYFYLPILQSSPDGCFTLFFYIVKARGAYVSSELDHAIRAMPDGSYRFLPFRKQVTKYSVRELDSYRRRIA